MTALTNDRYPAPRQLVATRRTFPVAANTVCYKGGMVGITVTSGVMYAQPMAPPPSGLYPPSGSANPLICVGVAEWTANNTGGAAGAVSVTCDVGVWEMNIAAGDPVTNANIGSTVYAADDNTVAATSNGGNRAAAGTLWWIDPVTGGALVKFS